MAQHPYGQPAGPGPYWQPQPPPPPPAPRSKVGLVVGIIVLVVVLLVAGVGGAVWLVRSRSAPVTTPQPTFVQEVCVGGDKITDPDFTFSVPVGWCVDHSGRQYALRTTTINVITITRVPVQAKSEQSYSCDKTTEKLGPYTKRPNGAWGNRTADAYTVTSGIFTGPVWCLIDTQYQYMMNGTVGGWGTMDEVEAALVQVVASWTWA